MIQVLLMKPSDDLSHASAHRLRVHLSLFRLEHPSVDLVVPDLAFEHLMVMVTRAMHAHRTKELRGDQQTCRLHGGSTECALVEINFDRTTRLLELAAGRSGPQQALQGVLDREVSTQMEHDQTQFHGSQKEQIAQQNQRFIV